MAKKILIIDDDPVIVDYLETLFKDNGYETCSASSSNEGMEVLSKEKPDLIILDLMLPKMDGHKVCALLKNDSRYFIIPIIMFTAKAQEEDMKLAKEVGADAYITKPFEPEILLGKVKELLHD